MGAHFDGLIPRGQKAIGPIGFAIRRLTTDIGNGNVCGKVFVLTSQRITQPGPGSRKAFRRVSGIHEHASRPVCIGLALHRMDEHDVVYMPGHVGQQTADPLAGLATRRERPGAFHQIAVLALKREETLLAGQGFAVPLLERRLVFPEIHLRDRTRTEDLKNTFGTGRVMRHPPPRSSAGLFGRCGFRQQLYQPDTGQARVNVAEKATAGKF